MNSATPRSVRSTSNRASYALARAEVAWREFVAALEALAELHDDAVAGPAARDVGREMYAFWEVLQMWSK